MNEQKDIGKLHAVVLENLPLLTPAQRRAGIKNPLRVQKYLAGLADALTDRFTLVPAFDRDMLKEGWRSLEKDHPDKDGEFTFELVDIFKGENVISGPGFEKRANVEEDIGGQRHLEAILREADKIPEEYRKFCLVATETVWVDSDGRRCVACLYWVGASWCLRFFWLDFDFDSYCRVVRSRKYQK
jgi:hypothetical protein